jgi:hypothetical protein
MNNFFCNFREIAALKLLPLGAASRALFIAEHVSDSDYNKPAMGW